MKNNKIWYVGYVVAIVSLFILFTFKQDNVMQIILTCLFSVILAISHVNIMHHKIMMKDSNYRVSVNDERNQKIQDKVNALMAPILMGWMGFIAVICMAIHAYLPAILLFVSVGGTNYYVCYQDVL